MDHLSGATNGTSDSHIRKRLKAAPLTLAGMIFLASLACVPAAFAQNDAWANGSNGNGQYHVSNGSASAQNEAGTNGSAGNGYYHLSNGSAVIKDKLHTRPMRSPVTGPYSKTD
jgi:hypothetical protein